MSDVLAVVVTYNRCELLRQCIKHIMSQVDSACDILVVDNASTDGTAQMLAKEFSDAPLKCLTLTENTGSAGGFYQGIREAVLRGYRRIWIMDDDVMPEDTALRYLLKADERLEENWSFLSSLALWTDGSPCKPNVQKTGVFSFVRPTDYGRDLVPVFMAAMASLYINADAVRAVGLPIRDYYFYTDDYEYTARLTRYASGFLVPQSHVVHKMAQNEKASLARAPREQLWRYRYLFRNDVHCYLRLGPRGWVYLVAKAGYTAINVMTHAKGDRLRRLGILAAGYAKGIAFKPIIEPYVSNNDLVANNLKEGD